MKEKDLNKKYIDNKLGGICQDCIYFERTIPVILCMIKEAYKSGLVQAEIDNTMGIIEENEKLRFIIKEVREYIEENKYKPSPLGYELELSPKRLVELLEILDKENKE